MKVKEKKTKICHPKNILILLDHIISSKDSDETSTLRTKSNNIEIMMGNETDAIIERHFESLLQKYQEGLEESMKRGSEFIFDSVDLLYYHLQKQVWAEREGHV